MAEALKDEYFYVAWRLRHEAFLRFGYDPDQVFCERIDEHGFKKWRHTSILESTY